MLGVRPFFCVLVWVPQWRLLCGDYQTKEGKVSWQPEKKDSHFDLESLSTSLLRPGGNQGNWVKQV